MIRCPLCGKIPIIHRVIWSEGQPFHIYFLPGISTDPARYCQGHSKHDPVFGASYWKPLHPPPPEEEERVPVPQVFYDAFEEGEG